MSDKSKLAEMFANRNLGAAMERNEITLRPYSGSGETVVFSFATNGDLSLVIVKRRTDTGHEAAEATVKRALAGPKSICTCGHTGDGPKSEHDAGPLNIAPGHGKCTAGKCACAQFTWAQFREEASS